MALAVRQQLSCLTGPDNGAYAVYTHIDVPPDTGEQEYCSGSARSPVGMLDTERGVYAIP
jgi:hypothetical protein